jgi:ferredoxin-NADP reductase
MDTLGAAIPEGMVAASARVDSNVSGLPRSFEVTVEEVKLESLDTVTLYLGTTGHPEYSAGQYLSIGPHQFRQLAPFVAWLEEQKGRKEPPRKYSLTSAPHERGLAITIKEEEYVPGRTRYPPLLSNLLARGLPRGARFTVFGCTGPYVLPAPWLDDDTLLVHVVAGSGAVPSYSIVKDALHRQLAVRQLWLASNKRREDVLFHEHLTQLEREHPRRLEVVNTLTRESQEGFHSGRISRELLEELIPEADRTTCRIYVCGPAIHPWDRRLALEAGTQPVPRFMETVLGHLHGMGIDPRRIKRESYG